MGLKLFRTLVSADLDVKQKTDSDGKLPLYLLYVSSEEEALEHKATLEKSFAALGSTPTRITTISLSAFLKQSDPEVAGVFLAQRLNSDELSQVIDKSVNNGLVLFSPFEGDVEQGVLGGLSVKATVRPLINMRTLQKSKLKIKSFYLKVATQHE